MGGEGSIQSMITSLRNNRNLLRKKSMFKRGRTFLSTRKEYYKTAKGKNIELKKASKEELQLIRNKIIKQRKVERIITLSIVIALFVAVIMVVFYFSHKQNIEKIKEVEIEKENYLHENINEYSYLIEEGDNWIDKKNWNNAIYRYKQAVELFPNEFEASYRLALTYSYSCIFENENCEIGETLTARLIKYYPDDPKLQELKKVFEK